MREGGEEKEEFCGQAGRASGSSLRDYGVCGEIARRS